MNTKYIFPLLLIALDVSARMDKEGWKMLCKKCDLQYSSYCVDCVYVKTGLNLSDEEYHEILKLRSEENEKDKSKKVY